MEHIHSHTHTHSHEHTHDGHTHTHEHGHAHEHDHAHPHTHDHLHEDGHTHTRTHSHEHHHHDDAAPMAQLCALVSYMVDHNTAHAGELAELAHQLKHAGKDAAYDKVMAAVQDFEKGNKALAQALAEIAK